MLMWLFVLFMAIALVLAIFGFAADFPVFNFTGMIMIFLLGMALLGGGVDYVVGTNSTTTVDAFNVTHEVTYNLLDNYDDAGSNRFGYFLLTLGSLGFILGFFRL